jgi:DNA-binding GntR family transcriptional regulator
LKRVAEWCHEHLAVIDALERGNLSNASKLLAQHLDSAATAAQVKGEEIQA